VREDTYKKAMLGVLLVLAAFNYLERHSFGLLLQEIKVDLALSDTQLGFLTGIAFAVFYSIMGIPIARWADRGNRVTIIAISAALSGVALALCGIAGSFLQLLMIRVGVAIGEAGCVPPAHSLIADYFSRAERPRAVGIYKLGIPLSMVIGYFLAGWLNELYGWRVTFMLLGLPGLALAALAWLTLREPRRGISTTVAAVAQPSLKEVSLTLWTNATFRNMLLGYSVGSFFSTGIAQWKAAFFIRSFGLQTGELGAWFAVIWGAGGFLGTYWGGRLASRHAAHNERLQLRAMAVAYSAFGIFSAGMYLASDYYLAFALMGLGALAAGIAIGPLFATIQTLVPERMRAMSIAIVFLCANLVGLGLGPLAAGVLSDAFRPWAGEESLRYALLVLCPGFLWCAWYLWRAGETVNHDLAR
jgi:MFS transporter, Spinster family, sphingosine-1-phosphate transporter